MEVANDRRPSIVPIEFRIEYLPKADGSVREIEVVEYTRKGSQGATTPARIEHLQRTRPGSDIDPVWLALKPFYDNWKQGKAAPIEGHPLGAWPGGTPQLTKALEAYHIRSVEDLANLTDATMDKVPVPGIRTFRTTAKAFVEAQKSSAPVAAKITTLEGENAELKTRIEELTELVQSLAADKGVTLTDAPKRGRPKKVA